MADSKESAFQADILHALSAHGWLIGQSKDYDPTTALYPPDLLAYFQDAWPDRWQKFRKNNPSNPETILIQKTAHHLDQQGTLHTLRHGFKVPGIKIELCSFKPDHTLNPNTLTQYRANRLRVIPELSYSPHARPGYNPRLDLVLFVNGIPTATLELKSEFKQSIEHAKRQYRHDRPPKDPHTHKAEPLLTFKRGALVHFAVTQQEVAMTTKLAGPDTTFLPFNQGSADGGAGNPPPPDENTYATAYLWQDLFQPDHWLHLIGRFLHLQKPKIETFSGKPQTPETLIFPRYHQWQLVTQLIATTRQEGPGHRYLIQHSAGSGKSNSIAWTAYQLAALYEPQGQKLFSSVIVVTDRTVLDSQLQDTIYQFDHTHGVVVPISRNESSQSKSAQLAQALRDRARIIIVTLQTFPALYTILQDNPTLASGNYAVIADEAHSSQTGTAANKLRAILGSDPIDPENLSAEDLLNAAIQARGPSDRISYYAFTATPKPNTLQLFGRTPDPTAPPSQNNKPQSFHVYSMQQAIEEGFILDVLLNYTPYDTAYRLAHPQGNDIEVETKQARKQLARWIRLHPYNISQKVQVIVEHFRDHVRHLLNGQAKAMVITSSRPEAVRYHLALQDYIREQGYTDVHSLVAFSGTVPPDEAIPEEVSETSKLLNPNLRGREMREAFDTADYNVMIVANKFQTGFDQPKLCALYVDKKLAGVDCVQTLSRLNRTFPGKQTFILDFCNEPQDILEAFLPYYRTAKLADVSDPDAIFQLQGKLDAEGIYLWSEVEAFARACLDPKANRAKLAYHCQPAVDRFRQRFRQAEAAQRQALADQAAAQAHNNRAALNHLEHDLKTARTAIEQLDLFRKNLKSFVRLYEFLSQIVNYEDPELEQLCLYAKHLYPLLRRDLLDQEKVDLSDLALTHYRLTAQQKQSLKLAEQTGEYTLQPGQDMGTGTAHDPQKQRLAEIIEQLNALFGTEVSNEDQVQFLEAIADRIRRQADVMAQIQHHSPEQVMHGIYPSRVSDTLLDFFSDNETLSTSLLGNPEIFHKFALLLLSIVLKPIAA